MKSSERPDKLVLPFIPRNIKNLLKDSFLRYPLQILNNLRFHFKAPKFYGQTAEDALLQRFLPEKKGTFVDIGGGHPIKYSNTYAFYKRGWRGISVDAIEFNSNIYRVLRPHDRSINALIGNSEGEERDFWIFEPYGLSTADPLVAAEVLKIKDVRLLKIAKIRMTRLADIVPEVNPSAPCFLSVDVEGLDLMVLKTNDWNRFRPRLICVEDWNGGKTSIASEIEVFLNSVNYSRVAFTGLSEIYVANEFS